MVERGTPVDLEYTKRYGALVAQHSIQDFYDLIVELITNPDDSYHGMFVDGGWPRTAGQSLSRSSRIGVIDRRSLPSRIVPRGSPTWRTKLRRVGERTSRAGDRGFMARGLKDCAAFGHVTVETIVDGRFDKAEITPAMQLIEWKAGRKTRRAGN